MSLINVTNSITSWRFNAIHWILLAVERCFASCWKMQRLVLVERWGYLCKQYGKMKDESLYVKGIRLVFVSPLSLGSSLLNFPSYKLSRFAPQPNTYIDSFMDCNNKPPSCYDCSLARHLLLFIITLSLRMPIRITHKIAVLSIIKLSAWR